MRILFAQIYLTINQRKTIVLALCCITLTAWNAVGWHQADEHFQILEFAAYKAGAVDMEELAWEFRERMRPAFQPFLVYLGYEALGGVGQTDPFTLAFILRLLSGLFFLLVSLLLYRRYSPDLPNDHWQKVLLGLLLLHWCGVYNGVRFSGENWSGLFLALGFVLHPTVFPKQHHDKSQLLQTFGIGLLFGLAFLCRYQVALLIIGLLLWLLFVAKERIPPFVTLCLGGLSAVAMGILLDYWLYDEWVLSSWNYLKVNLLDGKAASFGTLPWWGYFKEVFEKGVPPLSIIYIAATLYFFYRFRKHPITWMFLPFLLVHCLLSRKDVRFLFPLLPFVPVIIILTAQALKHQFEASFGERKLPKQLIQFLMIINGALLLSVLFRPMTKEVNITELLYDKYPEGFTMYAPGRDIYRFAFVEAKFYQRPHKVDVIRWEEQLHPISYPAGTILYVEKTRLPSPPAFKRLLYTDKPGWLASFNWGGWQDRKEWWWVYEL